MRPFAKSSLLHVRRTARIQEGFVAAELVAIAVIIGTMAEKGPDQWSVACWLLAVTLMLCSKALQAWWRINE